MKKTLINNKDLRNMRDGHHHRSKYWQDYRKSLPELPSILMEIAIAMVLSDAAIARTSKDAHMKIEQGYKQKEFVYHLFDLFKVYCFAVSPQEYIAKSGVRAGKVKSYWFKTLSHFSFTKIWNMFYVDGVKRIQSGLVLKYIGRIGLRYWIMSDGSLQNDKKSMILHTQCFTKEENEMLSSELNEKFGLHSKVIPHKVKYWVILIPSRDSTKLHSLISEHIIPYFEYKLPVIK